MDDRPNFRSRRHVRQLVIALLIPWLLFAAAYSLPLTAHTLYRAGLDVDWIDGPALVSFYLFGFPALLSLPVLFLFGVARLVWYREYRTSWYGWLWPFLMWVNLCLVITLIGH